MARSYSTNIPNPDDATNGVADTTIAVTAYRTAAGQPVQIRVDYPADPGGSWEVALATALPLAADRTAFRDIMLKILATYKTARGYV